MSELYEVKSGAREGSCLFSHIFDPSEFYNIRQSSSVALFYFYEKFLRPTSSSAQTGGRRSAFLSGEKK